MYMGVQLNWLYVILVEFYFNFSFLTQLSALSIRKPTLQKLTALDTTKPNNNTI